MAVVELGTGSKMKLLEEILTAFVPSKVLRPVYFLKMDSALTAPLSSPRALE